MGLNRKRKYKRRKGILYDYNGDCRFDQERIKGFWKRYWRRWHLRYLEKESLMEE
ncbi:hypothetical protein LCGC14_0828950 [marine sediment metagenome]|uniref:Uncharacterized protein n=1 Tax=marine sediment metagenome TaxID=412755 RepID=A0A0F9PL93_9ZZZZ